VTSVWFMQHHDGPERLSRLLAPEGDGLGSLVRRAGLLAHASRVLAAHLPSPLGSHCRVANVEGSTVVVQADSAAWAVRLRFMAPTVCDALSPLFAGPTLRHVKVSVCPPVAVAPVQPSDKRPALTAESARVLELAAEAVADPGLKDALRRLSRRSDRPG